MPKNLKNLKSVRQYFIKKIFTVLNEITKKWFCKKGRQKIHPETKLGQKKAWQHSSSELTKIYNVKFKMYIVDEDKTWIS